MNSIMRKTFIILGVFIIIHSTPTGIQTTAHTQQVIPTYAKWGKLAMQETQLKYPNAKIIDYLYEGNESNRDSTFEKFKLWLKDGDIEFGVFVKIEYTTETENVVNIEFQETSR